MERLWIANIAPDTTDEELKAFVALCIGHWQWHDVEFGRSRGNDRLVVGA